LLTVLIFSDVTRRIFSRASFNCFVIWSLM
jgi:hypothetical protein